MFLTYNSFQDRGGGSKSPPPQSDKVRIRAQSLRVKNSKKILKINVYVPWRAFKTSPDPIRYNSSRIT